jgi:hypothetical protein
MIFSSHSQTVLHRLIQTVYNNLCNDLGDAPGCFYFMSEYSVWNVHERLKVNKSSCDELLTITGY